MSFLGFSSKRFSCLFRCSDLCLFPGFFPISLIVIMGTIVRECKYVFSDHSYRSFVNLVISNFFSIILAIFMFIKESFA